MAHAQPWTSLALQALLELGGGSLSRAAKFFRLAAEALSLDKNSGSPCMGFVQNNLGIALLLQGKMNDARSAFASAHVEWERTRVVVEGAAIAPPIASSGHQLRLASHHGDAFGDAHKRAWSSLLCAASEITRANAALTSPDATSSPVDAELLARVLGDRSFAAVLARAGGSASREIENADRRFHELARNLLAAPQPTTLSFTVERAADLTLLAHPYLSSPLRARSAPDGTHPPHYDPREI